MSLAIVHSRAQLGVAAPLISVEVHLSGGLPATSIVGLPEAAVRESRDRVRAALINALFEFPQRRITVGLAPADLPKDGSRFDLAIALGILAASGQIPESALAEFECFGELALSGELRPITGVLPAVLQAHRAGRKVLLPHDNGAEAALVGEAEVYTARSLLQVCAFLRGDAALARAEPDPIRIDPLLPDLQDVCGQGMARRALEVAACGGHNLLFIGPPGTGKTMLASRLPGILPPMTEAEALESAAVASICGMDVRPFLATRSFRNPHHSASAVALVGGGSDISNGKRDYTALSATRITKTISRNDGFSELNCGYSASSRLIRRSLICRASVPSDRTWSDGAFAKEHSLQSRERNNLAMRSIDYSRTFQTHAA
jgi:magnesium chelatase family protein